MTLFGPPKTRKFGLGLAVIVLVHGFCEQRRPSVTLPLPKTGTLVHEEKRFLFSLVCAKGFCSELR